MISLMLGDCLERMAEIEAGSVHTCITSPPYFGLRDYGHAGQIGLEPTPEAFVARLVEVFREVRRILRDDGTLWLNLGDSYGTGASGQSRVGLASDLSKPRGYGRGETKMVTTRDPVKGFHKQLLGIPWRVAFALQADGWYLRSDIIWHKPNPMPESVTDRPTKAHEYLFLLSKRAAYYYDADAVREPLQGTPQRRHTLAGFGRKGVPGRSDNNGAMSLRNEPGQDGNPLGRNRRSVWTVATKPFREAHFATFPEKLIEPCVLAGCPEGGTVLDPFAGAGTTGVVAVKHGRNFVGCELNPAYREMALARIKAAQDATPLLTGAAS